MDRLKSKVKDVVTAWGTDHARASTTCSREVYAAACKVKDEA